MKKIILILLLLSTTCFGQVYISTSFQPPAILSDGNTFAWYDYRTGITMDESNRVSLWADRLGTTTRDLRNLSGSSIKYPIFSSEGLTFDGIDDYLNRDYTINQPLTYYVVFKQLSSTDFDYILCGGSSTSTSILRQYNQGLFTVFTNSQSNLYDYQLPVNSWGVAQICLDSNSSKFRINNNTSLYFSYNFTNQLGLTVGAMGNLVQYYGNFIVKEIIIRNVIDSEANQKLIYEYLRSSHNIPYLYASDTTFTFSNPYTDLPDSMYKGNFHGHTTNSDGVMTPTEYMTAYLNAGFDFASISDHDVLTADPEVSGILFIPAVEESVNRALTPTGHIQFINATKNITDTTAQAIIDTINANNGIAVLNHLDYGTTGWTLDEMLAVTGYRHIEVYNGYVNQTSTAKWDSVLKRGTQLYAIATDDVHTTNIGFGYVIVYADSLTKDLILSAVDTGKYYSTNGNTDTISVTTSNIGITITTTSLSRIYWYVGNASLTQNAKTDNTVTTSTFYPQLNDVFVRAAIRRNSDTKWIWLNPFYIIK